MTESACPVCGSPRIVLGFSATDRGLRTTSRSFSLSKCSECGCYFQNPPPTAEEIASFYPAEYSSFDLPVTVPLPQVRRLLERRLGPSDIPVLRRAGLDSRIAMLLAAGPGDRHFGSVLDVGAGSGHFLASLREVVPIDALRAVDLSPVAVRRCKERGIPAVVGTIHDVPEHGFDLVVLNHTLEHVLDPGALVRACADRLHIGGYCLLSLPDVNSIYHRVLRYRWGGFDIPRHIVNFTRAGVALLLRPHFEVVHHFSDRFFMSNFAQFFERGLAHRMFWHRASLAVWRAMERLTDALNVGDQQVWLCRKKA